VAMRRWVLILLAAAMTLFLAGCGGSTANVQNPPTSAAAERDDCLSTGAWRVAQCGISESVTAVVTNDPDSEGVSWELTCPARSKKSTHGLCGTLSRSAHRQWKPGHLHRAGYYHYEQHSS